MGVKPLDLLRNWEEQKRYSRGGIFAAKNNDLKGSFERHKRDGKHGHHFVAVIDVKSSIYFVIASTSKNTDKTCGLKVDSVKKIIDEDDSKFTYFLTRTRIALVKTQLIKHDDIERTTLNPLEVNQLYDLHLSCCKIFCKCFK